MSRGRKSAWIEKIQPRLEEIKAWCRDGLIDKQMCELLGISRKTFYKYKKQYSDFSNALKVTKEIADLKVENSLYKRAMGFDYEEKKITETNGVRSIAVTKKIVLPDTTAQIFWLKNRKPEFWRDKHDIDHTSKGEQITGININIVKTAHSNKEKEQSG